MIARFGFIPTCAAAILICFSGCEDDPAKKANEALDAAFTQEAQRKATQIGPSVAPPEPRKIAATMPETAPSTLPATAPTTRP